MCVAAYSPAGVAIPSDKDIEAMFKKNPHGAGMAITRPDGFTEWHKGYMDLESFKAKLNEFDADTLKDNPVTLHFRITTKGKTDAETCHPFPVSPQFSDMRKLHGITQSPLAFHNGTITGFGGIASEVSSDTQDFVMGPLYYLLKGVKPGKKIGALRTKAIEQLLGSSRLVIMMPNQKVTLLGTTWTKHTDNCHYSNMLWVPKPASNYQVKHVPTYQAEPRVADEWGKHSYSGVWPGDGKEWIEFKNETALEAALKSMEKVQRDGITAYKHKISGNIYYRQGELELLTEEGFKLMADYYIDQHVDEYEEMAADGSIEFLSIQELQSFLELCTENEDGTYEYEKQDWYVDYDVQAMYTKDYLQAYFPDDIDEVLKSLLENGYIEGHIIEDEEAPAETETKMDKPFKDLSIEEKVELVQIKLDAKTA